MVECNPSNHPGHEFQWTRPTLPLGNGNTDSRIEECMSEPEQPVTDEPEGAHTPDTTDDGNEESSGDDNSSNDE